MNFGYWPEVQRGNERVVHDLAVELARRGHRPSIITSHSGSPTREMEEGVQVLRNWRPPDLPLRLRRFQEHLTHLPFSYRDLVRTEPDLAIAYFPTDAAAAARWGKKSGRPTVYSFTGIFNRQNVASVRLRRRVLEVATRETDAVVGPSKAARDSIWRWLAVEARVIHNGVDLSRFEPGERASVPTIGCAVDGSDGRKRVPLLLRAFEILRRDRPDAELVLVEPEDPAVAQELLGTPGVRLLPRGVETPRIIFQSSWASVLCSEREAFGLVLIESLACGTPVVGTRDGAIPEIIDRPEIGQLFDGDERNLARALEETLALREDQGTVEACQSRAADFSIERSAAAHEDLFSELLAR
jgi:phosphatidylinositol alpha-mannosyltransferase